MPVAPNLSLRVNGRLCEQITIWLSLEQGYPSGPKTVTTPRGSHDLDIRSESDFIEIKEGEGAPWRDVALGHVLALLEVT